MKNTDVAIATYCLKCGNRLQWANIDGSKRQHCSQEQCDFVVWDNPVPVVAAIVLLEGKLFLARNSQWPPGYLSIISGYLEKGEAPESAVRRELVEETGLQAQRVQLLGLYMCHELNQMLVVYVVDAKGEICLGSELAEYRLVSPRDLRPQMFGFGARATSWSELGMGVGPAMRDFLQTFHRHD